MKRRLSAIVCVLALIFSAGTVRASFTFDDIRYWVGTGTNRAALAIDWSEGSTNPPALVWGFRWNGAATGATMLTAIVKADDRLFAKFAGSPGTENAFYGLGYDADNNGQFALDDGTSFDSQGIAYTDPADGGASVDGRDYYAEGWFTGFWHYGVASSDPFNGGAWTDSPTGMVSRTLADGSWDSWAFQSSTVPPFTTFANNPQAAAAPPGGDFNGDRRVDSADYSVWKTTFGSMTQLAADANGNGIVDAADYTIWRDHFVPAGSAALGQMANVPEPSAMALLGSLVVLFVLPRGRVMTSRLTALDHSTSTQSRG